MSRRGWCSTRRVILIPAYTRGACLCVDYVNMTHDHCALQSSPFSLSPLEAISTRSEIAHVCAAVRKGESTRRRCTPMLLMIDCRHEQMKLDNAPVYVSTMHILFPTTGR